MKAKLLFLSWLFSVLLEDSGQKFVNCLAMTRYSTSVSISQVLGKTLVKAVSTWDSS